MKNTRRSVGALCQILLQGIESQREDTGLLSPGAVPGQCKLLGTPPCSLHVSSVPSFCQGAYGSKPIGNQVPMIRDSQALLCLGQPLCTQICQSGPVSRLGCSQKRLYQACFESCLVPRMSNPRSFSSLMPDYGALGTGKGIRREGRVKAESEAWPGGK